MIHLFKLPFLTYKNTKQICPEPRFVMTSSATGAGVGNQIGAYATLFALAATTGYTPIIEDVRAHDTPSPVSVFPGCFSIYRRR